MLFDFFKGYVLYWIEVMSWLGKEIEVINLFDELYVEVNKVCGRCILLVSNIIG